MLPSEHRMRRRDEFTLAVRRGRRAGRPNLVLHLLSGADPQADIKAAPVAGFIVAKTVGNAVVRNKVRRRLRHIVRAHVHRLPAGSLLVVRANPRAATAHHDELVEDFEAGIQRLLGPDGATRVKGTR
ncbi:MAG: ribonuclease protein component [Actinomycetia bacterium]|nr:ribonuclease protein component [Actinomycetes bacterium]